MKKKETFKYNAFISYRHADLDKFVAENLHKLIETYKMPKPVVEKYNITDNNVRRIFRDQDELPLSSSLEDPIIEALKNSEFLIVICSPRIKESLWCKKEIESFIKFRGRNNVICVLIEGDPEDSFPEEVLYYEEKVKNKAGKTVKKKVYCEPLAMDVRGSNKREVYKKLKSELIRVIAPLYKLDYDDIKRRHEERELKRKANIFKIAMIASIIFGIYSFALFSRIYISSKQLKYHQSINLADEARKLLAKDDRVGATLKAYQSVTKYEGIKMPVTSQGIHQLTNSLGVYNIRSSTYSAISQLDTLGIVKLMKTDVDGKYLLSYDDSGELILWDLKKEKRIKTVYDCIDSAVMDDEFTFIGKEKYAYISNDYNVVVRDIKGKQITKIKLKYVPQHIDTSKNSKYLEIAGSSGIDIYETENYTLVASYEVPSGFEIKYHQYFDDKEENILFTLMKENASSNDNGLHVLTYNIETQNIISDIEIDAHFVEKILFYEDNATILSNRSISLFSSDMIITNYNYKNGERNHQNEYEGKLGIDVEMTFSENEGGTLLVATGSTLELFELNTGNKKLDIVHGSEVVYTYPIDGTYLVFTKTGDVFWIKNSDDMYSLIPNLTGYFDLDLNNYAQFLHTSIGYLGYASSDNRIIIYNKLKNDDYKEIKYEEKKFDELDYSNSKKIKNKYEFKNKDLISHMFYSKDKKLLFVVYKHNVLEVYNSKTKEMLKRVENFSKDMKNFVCQTEDNEYIIKSVGSGYILNKDFDIIASVAHLYDYKDGKIIIKDGKHYYKVKKYSEKEIINKGKEFLKSKGKILN